MKRGRNQRRRPGGGANPNRALDSNGPDVRIRGTANQIYDKYLALARDASSSGDRVKAESYLQHAEHYFRLIRSMTPAQAPQHASTNDDSDQPSLDDNDQQPEDRRLRDPHQRGDERRQRETQSNGGEQPDASVEAASVDAATSGAGDEDSDADNTSAEEKKPRRRRAPRRSSQRADAGDAAPSEEPTPAAAE